MHPPPRSSIQLESDPSTSNQIYSLPSSSTHLHPAHLNHHPALCNTLNVISTNSLLLVISRTLGRKIHQFKIWQEIGTHVILEGLILNPDSILWNSDSKIDFWANLGRKSKKCRFCLKIYLFILFIYLFFL